MRSSSTNMRSGHLLCLLLSLFGDVSRRDRETCWKTSFEGKHIFRHRCARHLLECRRYPALTRLLRGRIMG